MSGYVVDTLVVLIFGSFGLLAARGEKIQRWLEDRRLRRHTCHTRCTESRWCACGCRDGLYGDSTGTRCAVCGTQYVMGEAEPAGIEITQEVMMPAPGQTTWGWRREKQERIQAAREWERDRGY